MTGVTRDTTQRDDESLVGEVRPRLWLNWVFPKTAPALTLDHGLVIGRDPECDVCLDGTGVSRRHVEVYRQGPLFALKDLGSTNGTFVNGKRVQHAPVAPGSVLRVGEHVGVFMESVAQPGGFQKLATGLFGGHEVDLALASARRAATSGIPIVVTGATGTGKERVARAIHEWSGRTGAFQALNCAALPKDLAEAELFGYRKGAFTGAERASLGHFRAAEHGTIFLDEILELPLALQAKLLRVLEEGVVLPIGETDPVPIDVRVVVAAQRPLLDAVAAQAFRQDLAARLAGLTVKLPTLKDRSSDVAPLFSHFIARYSGGRPPLLDPKLVEALCFHQWPANVRELELLARQMLAVHGLEPVLKRSALPKEVLAQLPPSVDSMPPPSVVSSSRKDYDGQRLAQALQKENGNVAQAAASLGFSRQRAYRLLEGTTPAALIAKWSSPGSETPEDGSS